MMLEVAALAAQAAFNVVDFPSSCPLSSEDDVPLILGTSSLVAMTLLLLLLLLLRLLLLLLRLLFLLLRLLLLLLRLLLRGLRDATVVRVFHNARSQ